MSPGGLEFHIVTVSQIAFKGIMLAEGLPTVQALQIGYCSKFDLSSTSLDEAFFSLLHQHQVHIMKEDRARCQGYKEDLMANCAFRYCLVCQNGSFTTEEHSFPPHLTIKSQKC